MTSRGRTLMVPLLLAVALFDTARALPDEPERDRSLRPGSVELGISGLLTSVEGTVQAKVGLRGGTFFAAPIGLWGTEAEASYAYIRSLHQVDLEASVSWTFPVDVEGILPYLAVASGIRIEQVGSYRQTLVPIGGTAGLRILATKSAGVRLDVKIRRMMNDPVQDYTEINLALGISLFLQP